MNRCFCSFRLDFDCIILRIYSPCSIQRELSEKNDKQILTLLIRYLLVSIRFSLTKWKLSAYQHILGLINVLCLSMFSIFDKKALTLFWSRPLFHGWLRSRVHKKIWVHTQKITVPANLILKVFISESKQEMEMSPINICMFFFQKV